MAGGERETTYDRQLRLWGEHGQRAIEAAHVCLAGASPAGTEALKALALAGVGAITIVDGEDVAPEHLGAEFFLEAESVGRGRAAETVRLLAELNPAVRGHAVAESPATLLDERPDFFRAFSLVIACGLGERELVALAADLWDADVPLIACRSVGMLASLRVQVREHAVVEAHPDDRPPDLRLLEPFPTLAAHVDSYELDALELKEHAHVPWLVIVAQAARDWSRARGGAKPTSREEREQVRALIASRRRRDERGAPVGEENFEEAIRATNVALTPATVPTAVRAVLDDERCANPTPARRNAAFWIACAALRAFVDEEGGGALPVRGVVPDMTATTGEFVALQNVYRAKASADADAVYARAARLAAELGVDGVTEADVRALCKHASCLRVVRGSSLEDEYRPSGAFCAYVARHLEEPDPMMVHYVVLRAAERFRSEQCRAPGEWDPEADVPKLKSYVAKLLAEWSCPPLADDDYAHEMCRYGGAELHSVCAFVGGCAAQEAIKLITRQYVPVDNFFVHEAMTTNSATFTF